MLPKDVNLTDANREQYYIEDVVLPLWEGGMINAVRSGDIDVTSSEKLHVGAPIKIDWDGSYGVETTEIVVTVNDMEIEIEDIVDKDGPEMITLYSSALKLKNGGTLQAKEGDKLEVYITVTVPDSEIAAQLPDGSRSKVPDSWKGTFEDHTIATKTISKATQYEQNNDLHVGYHHTAETKITYCTKCSYQIKGETTYDSYVKHTFENYVCTQCEYDMEGEYLELLRSLPGEADPMQNGKIRDIMWTELTNKLTTTEVANEILDLVASAPSPYKEIYVYSFFFYDKEISSSSRSHFDDTNNVLAIEESSRSDINTILHESGHAIDYNATHGEGYRSAADNEVIDKIEIDARGLIEEYFEMLGFGFSQTVTNNFKMLSETEKEEIISFIIGPEQNQTKIEKFLFWPDVTVDVPDSLSDKAKEAYEMVVESICKKLFKLREGACPEMTLDVIGGITNNVLYGAYGHSRDSVVTDKSGKIVDRLEEYWYKADGTNPEKAQALEAWANNFDTIMCQKDNEMDINNDYLKNTCLYLDNVLAIEMLQYYKNQVF